MVGLKNMSSKKPNCFYYSMCRNQANTYCDKSEKPICPDCSTIVPNGETVKIIAKKHAPKKHIAKCIEAALRRGVKYDI